MWWTKPEERTAAARRDRPFQSFDIDQKTYDLLVTMRDAFGASDNVGVLRKAVVLASLISEHAQGHHQVTIKVDLENGESGPPLTVILNG